MLCEVRGSSKLYVRAFPRLNISGAPPMFVFPRAGNHSPLHIADQSRVSFVVAVCLFGAWSVLLRDRHQGITRPMPITSEPFAERVDAIEAEDRFSLYELETTARLTRLTAAIGQRMPAGMPIEVVMQVPRQQYYMYLLDAWEQGLVPTSVFCRWLRLVDQRHARVCSLLRQQLRQRLSGPMMIRVADSLEEIGSALTDWAAGGRPVSLAWCLARLADRRPLWRRVLEFHHPRTWSQLWRLSYVVEQLSAGRLDEPNDRTLMVAIQDPAEELTFEAADRIASQIRGAYPGSYSSCGLYPLERVIATENAQRISLYRGSPPRDLVDDRDKPWTPRQIVNDIYQDSLVDSLAVEHCLPVAGLRTEG